MSIISINNEKEPELFNIELRVDPSFPSSSYNYSNFFFNAYVDWNLAVAVSSQRLAEIVRVDWERKQNDGSWAYLKSTTAEGFLDTTVVASGTYEYRARILDTGNVFSPYSNEVTIIYTQILATPPIAKFRFPGNSTFFSSTNAVNKPSFPDAPAAASDVIFLSGGEGFTTLIGGSTAQAGIVSVLWEVLQTQEGTVILSTPFNTNCGVTLTNTSNPKVAQFAYIKLTVTDSQGQTADLTTQRLY